MNTVKLNTVTLDGGMIIKKGSGGGKVFVLESWADYDADAMADYALSAQLGYELHTELEGVDSMLDEINGASIEMINEINGEII